MADENWGFRQSRIKRCYVTAHQGPFEDIMGPHLLSVIYSKRCVACGIKMELLSAMPAFMSMSRELRDMTGVFERSR